MAGFHRVLLELVEPVVVARLVIADTSETDNVPPDELTAHTTRSHLLLLSVCDERLFNYTPKIKKKPLQANRGIPHK